MRIFSRPSFGKTSSRTPPLALLSQAAGTPGDIHDLPVPPSINRLGRTGRGRLYRSKRYTARSKVTGWELAMQRPKRITGQVIVTIAASWICWLRTRSPPILRRATSISDYSEDVTT